jgi:sugar-specific transcriptional regulator TrmB
MMISLAAWPTAIVCTMELLDRVEKEIRDRLEELRPLIREAERLEAALKQLGSQKRASGGAATTSRRSRSATAGATRARGAARRTTGTRRRGRRTRVSGEKRREQLVSLARENPDIKAREIAERLGTTPNNIYNLIRRLEAEGTISRRDGRLVVRR